MVDIPHIKFVGLGFIVFFRHLIDRFMVYFNVKIHRFMDLALFIFAGSYFSQLFVEKCVKN